MGIRLIIIGVIIAAIMAAVGGFFLYQKSIVNDLEAIIVLKDQEIHTLREQVAGLEIDNIQLKISNQAMVEEIDRKVSETKEAYAEIAKLNAADAASRERLNQVETLLTDKARASKLDRIRNSRKASLLLRLLDREIKCYIENFHRVGEGRCIAGKFVPTGERFDGKEITNEKD